MRRVRTRDFTVCNLKLDLKVLGTEYKINRSINKNQLNRGNLFLSWDHPYIGFLIGFSLKKTVFANFTD